MVSDGRKFFRNWAPGSGVEAGKWGRDEMRNITGEAGEFKSISNPMRFSGALALGGTTQGSYDNNGTGPSWFTLDASLVVPTGPQNVPQHVWQPAVLYLGRPA